TEKVVEQQITVEQVEETEAEETTAEIQVKKPREAEEVPAEETVIEPEPSLEEATSVGVPDTLLASYPITLTFPFNSAYLQEFH
ncbi:hypothetical protein Q6294_32190, partial [Klebsiella pneumoniae]